MKMPATSTIGSNGNVTVPSEVRGRPGLKEGDSAELVADQEQTILRPACPVGNPFEKYVGSLPAFQTSSEINAWVADLRDEEKSDG